MDTDKPPKLHKKFIFSIGIFYRENVLQNAGDVSLVHSVNFSSKIENPQ